MASWEQDDNLEYSNGFEQWYQTHYPSPTEQTLSAKPSIKTALFRVFQVLQNCTLTEFFEDIKNKSYKKILFQYTCARIKHEEPHDDIEEKQYYIPVQQLPAYSDHHVDFEEIKELLQSRKLLTDPKIRDPQLLPEWIIFRCVTQGIDPLKWTNHNLSALEPEAIGREQSIFYRHVHKNYMSEEDKDDSLEEEDTQDQPPEQQQPPQHTGESSAEEDNHDSGQTPPADRANQ